MGIIVVLVLVVVVAGFVIHSRRQAVPSAQMFASINDSLRLVQQKASAAPFSDRQAKELHGMNAATMGKMQDQTVVVNGTIRLIYTVEEKPEGFLHVISSQMVKSRPAKYHISCMLVVMLVLNQQLAEAGIDANDVKFGMEESELGTRYVNMLLTADQHRILTDGAQKSVSE